LGALLLRRPDVTAVGTDISPAALAVAEGNWRDAGVSHRVDGVETDLLAGVEGPFDLILSNPPYIATAEYEGLDRSVRGFEPKLALEAGAEGLDVYRRLIPQAAEKLVKGGALLLEIGWKQGPAVAGLLQQDQWHDVSTLQDLAGRDRVVSARRR
jgi:release factor glutamine methyltransferase